MLSCNNVTDILRKYTRYTDVEFIIGTKCQNACRYCYRVPYQNQSGYDGMSLQKMKLYYDRSVEAGLIPLVVSNITLFGGDPVVDLDYLSSFLDEFSNRCSTIPIPTNGRILEHLHDTEIQQLHDISKNKLHMSLSIDGPFVENINRPLSTFGKMQGFQQERNWNRLIAISRKFNYGWHPMFWFETVTTWFDTWKWFLDNDLHVYLLEVRHGSSSDDQLIEGVSQIAKILTYCAEHSIANSFNGTQYSTTVRGLGCSALNTLHINQDGNTYFCHRLIKDPYKIADLNTSEINLNNFIAMGAGFDYHNSPVCMICPIRNGCAGSCVGMIDEYWDRRGAVGVPIPSMCKYYLLKFGYLFYLGLYEWEPTNKDIDIDAINDAVFHNFGYNIYNDLDRRRSQYV